MALASAGSMADPRREWWDMVHDGREFRCSGAYDPSREDFRTRHYLFDQAIRELKASP
jgi:hypothetical protein